MKILAKHLDESGLTYFQHMKRAARISSACALISLALIIHGLFPFLLTSYATTKLEELSDKYL